MCNELEYEAYIALMQTHDYSFDIEDMANLNEDKVKWAVDNNRIEIGNNVLIASNVQIYTATHSTNVKERTMQNWDESKAICNTFALPIKIEDNVWIGGGAIILPGVTIGRNSVIGAGSVVTRSIPADCVAVGNPCRVIKHMNNEPD